jgi:hypothetical protein
MSGTKDTELIPMQTERAPRVSELLCAAAECVRTDDMVDVVSGRNTPLTLHKAQFANAAAYADLVEVLKRLFEASSEEAALHPEGWCPKCGLTLEAFQRMLSCRNMTLVMYRDGSEKTSTSSVTCDFEKDSCSVDVETDDDGTARITKLCAC